MSERSEPFPLATSHAMLLTPPGPAAIAVVRLVGPRVDSFLADHFSRLIPTGRAVHGELREAGRVIDDPLVCRVRDDAADLSLHGNATIVRAVLQLAARAGFAMAAGDDSSLDAFDGETVLDREVAAALPRARTELAWRTLLAQPAAWAILPTMSIADRAAEARRMLADRSLHYLLSTPRVAIVGLPNAGKSTLANALAGVDRHITADVAGTTRDWVGSVVAIDGLAVELVDTPGLRETSDPLEGRAIELAAPVIAAADCVLLVLDATRVEDAEQQKLQQKFSHPITISSKCDLAPPLPGTIAVSVASNSGISAIRSAILRAFACDGLKPNQPLIWKDRQREIVGAWTP